MCPLCVSRVWRHNNMRCNMILLFIVHAKTNILKALWGSATSVYSKSREPARARKTSLQDVGIVCVLAGSIKKNLLPSAAC